ncbi:DUF6017 domain-containing protein [Parablautia sp. Marseille-Q6255]|uniref:DUF6017 domain-containing protein n=1 Tax=Parablautia sp. Marseille-Q6255 TaxID=3039593 RepID=UPI002F3E256C
MADQFGFTKRDATNAVVELEKLGVIKRVFRTIERGGHLVSNVLFLELHVDILEQLTYPENFGEERKACKGSPRFEGEVSPKSGRGISDTGYMVSPESVRDVTQKSDTNTDTTNIDYNKDFRFVSFETAKERIRKQIDYEVLKFDYPYDKRIEEIVGIMTDVMTSTAQVIRVNKEDKPASIVKAQFAKLSKEHVEYVLERMDETQTKARNIRAVLITALYNSVHTMSSYYGNLYQYYQSLD